MTKVPTYWSSHLFGNLFGNLFGIYSVMVKKICYNHASALALQKNELDPEMKMPVPCENFK